MKKLLLAFVLLSFSLVPAAFADGGSHPHIQDGLPGIEADWIGFCGNDHQWNTFNEWTEYEELGAGQDTWEDTNHDGPDCVDGGDDADTLTGKTKDDTLSGGAQGDYISGGDGWDYLAGFGGADEIWAGVDPDIVYGGTGQDYLVGGLGDDQMWGGHFCGGEPGEGHTDYYGFVGDHSTWHINNEPCGTDNADEIYAGGGDDWVWESNSDNVGDGYVDYVDGGGGTDDCTVETTDYVVDCETVHYL